MGAFVTLAMQAAGVAEKCVDQYVGYVHLPMWTHVQGSGGAVVFSARLIARVSTLLTSVVLILLGCKCWPVERR